MARIDYTIESIASDQFEAAANRIEGQRMARGAAAYVAEFEDAVEEIYKSAVQALRAYLKKVSAPFAEVLHRSNPSGVGFVPVLGRRVQVRGTPLCSLPVRVVDSGTRFSVFGRSGDEFIVSAPTPEVPELPAPVSAAPDVRERTVNGNLELCNGEGTDGLSLLDGDKEPRAGGPMLLEPTTAGDGDGVDTTRDWDAMI